MLQTIYRILDDGIKKYPGNNIFITVKNLVATTNGVPSLIKLYAAVSQPARALEVMATQSPAANVDRRINNLILSSVKCYSGGINYGIRFGSTPDAFGQKPISTVILGNNGTGKTSCYCGLEMIAMHHSYIGDVHGYSSKEEQINYIKNASYPNSAPEIIITDTNGNMLEYSDEDSELCPRAFFCSIFDIHEIQTNGISRDYLLQQIGRLQFSKLVEVLKKLSAMTERLHEVYKLSLQKKQAISKEDKESLEEKISKQKRNVKTEFNFRRNSFIKHQWADETTKQNLIQVAQFLDAELDKALKQITSVAERLLPNLINDYLKDDNARIIVNFDGETINPEIEIAGKTDRVKPRQWFNTFRMKLYIAVLKMSLAFTVKIIDNLNFPIVMDDIFDASDFFNKYEIRRLFKEIVQKHSEIAEFRNLPLQIIFFTQDQVVGENVYKGLAFGSDTSEVQYLRLFHPNECVKKTEKTPGDIETLLVSGEPKLTYLRITDTIIPAHS